MSAPATHNLDSIVDIVVNISPLAAPRATFDQLLIQGTTILPSAPITESERIRVYESAADMLTDGFKITDPEYMAALLYFGQSPAPNRVWIGMRNASTTGIDAFHFHDGGAGYHIGDILTVIYAGASGGTIRVTSIGAAGIVTGIELVTRGTLYAVADSNTTSVVPTGGTGCTIDITALAVEDVVEALAESRAANYDWYVAMDCDAVAADHEACALWAESATPSSIYVFTTRDSDVPTSATTDVFTILKGQLYSRTMGQYSSKSLYAIAAIMGYAMGANSKLANSAYTLKFKNEVGMTVESLTSTQINNIEGKNGNVYINYGNYYDIFEQGVMSNGSFFDEKINLDMLVNNIQLSVMDLLYQSPKVPQTEPGVAQIIHAINMACEQAVTIGFLAPGKWTGRTILNLSEGDVMPNGYLVQAAKIADQSQADREARKSPSIYVAIKEAGAIHSVLIGVYVNR